MVAAKGLSTFKSRVSGERETRKSGISGRFRSLKVYTEDTKIKIMDRDGVPAESKKSIPVKAEFSQIHANCQKEALNKFDKIGRKSINLDQARVGRKVLADISNSRGVFQKNAAADGSKPEKGKMERMTYSRRALVSLGKDLKVFDGSSKTRVQETVGDVTRKSLPVLKRANKGEKPDVIKGNNDNKLKNKEKHGFSVKPKVGLPVVPQVSNTHENRWKNRVSDGCIKMPSQPTGDKQRLSRISMKPTVGIPKAQRVSRTTSIFTKSTSATFVLPKKIEEITESESISCKQIPKGVTLDTCTSKLTSKGKSGRRKSYTSSLIENTKLLMGEVSGTKEEILPNIYDAGNQLEAAEYIDEIYRHYWVTEANNQPLKNYMEIQTHITPQMRGILINWLIEVHLKFDLMQETLYLMVTLLDFYLTAVTIKRTELQLVGLTSLLLASKYEDFWHPRVMELISISAETYTKEQMLAMETKILTTLNFRLNLPTPYVFMLRFLKAAQGDKKFENLAFFLIELCLVEYDALHYKPSLLCASAIYVARCTLHLTPTWTPLLCKHSKYQEFQIRDCAEMILGFHQATRKTALRVTYDKYTSCKNYEVALIKPLDRLPSP